MKRIVLFFVVMVIAIGCSDGNIPTLEDAAWSTSIDANQSHHISVSDALDQ